MTDINLTKRTRRVRRHKRIRAKIVGTAERPRIAVFKSATAVYAQAIDDTAHVTVAAVRDADLKKKGAKIPEEVKEKGAKVQHAFAAGVALGELLKEKGVSVAVFDTGGFVYHGRVQAIADGLRHAGIKI